MSRKAAHDKLTSFHEYLRTSGLKTTRQRDEIASWFFEVEGHHSADDIYRQLRQTISGVGVATVYRTLRLLCDAGLVHERHFGDGEALYENVALHHDHCICTACGSIVEFENPRIEQLQEEVAERYGFKLVTHKMELYGLCKKCGPKAKAAT